MGCSFIDVDLKRDQQQNYVLNLSLLFGLKNNRSHLTELW